MIRTIYSVFVVSVSSILIGIPTILLFVIFPTGKHVVIAARYWSRLILLACNVKLKVSGTENFLIGKPCVYMSSHRSHFDLLALMRILPGQYRAVAKKSLFYIPIFGWIIWMSGFISIDRSNRRKAFKSIDRAAKKIASGIPVLIFPEGTRNPEGKGLLPFKKGAFHLAGKSGVPIIPIVIKGSNAILPKKSLKIHSGTIEVFIGPAIRTADYSEKERTRLSDKVREDMLEMLGTE